MLFSISLLSCFSNQFTSSIAYFHKQIFDAEKHTNNRIPVNTNKTTLIQMPSQIGILFGNPEISCEKLLLKAKRSKSYVHSVRFQCVTNGTISVINKSLVENELQIVVSVSEQSQYSHQLNPLAIFYFLTLAIGLQFIPGTTCQHNVEWQASLFDLSANQLLAQFTSDGSAKLWRTEIHATNDKCSDSHIEAEVDAFTKLSQDISVFLNKSTL